MRVENTEKELQVKLNAIKKIMSKDIILNNDIEKKLKQFLVEHDVSPYAYAKEIEDFFKQEGQDIPYFRVIKRYSNKKQQFFPKEAFATV